MIIAPVSAVSKRNTYWYKIKYDKVS